MAKFCVFCLLALCCGSIAVAFGETRDEAYKRVGSVFGQQQDEGRALVTSSFIKCGEKCLRRNCAKFAVNSRITYGEQCVLSHDPTQMPAGSIPWKLYQVKHPTQLPVTSHVETTAEPSTPALPRTTAEPSTPASPRTTAEPSTPASPGTTAEYSICDYQFAETIRFTQHLVDSTPFKTHVWDTWKNGFGTPPSGPFFLGMEWLHDKTKNLEYGLRVDQQHPDGTWYCSVYTSFSVGPETDDYRLSVGGYLSNYTGGDSLIDPNPFPGRVSNGQKWSTSLRGPATGCAGAFGFPWWFQSCTNAAFSWWRTVDSVQRALKASYWSVIKF